MSGCAGDILMTQSPAAVLVQPGGSATLSCKASSNIDDDLAWYHHKPGQAPKFIINLDTAGRAGIKAGRYHGTGYDIDFALTINNVQAEDAGDYYCQQHEAFPFTQ